MRDNPSKIVTIFINSFCKVFEILFITPHSLARLPKVKAPIKGQASGKNIIHKVKTRSGKEFFHVLLQP